MHCRLSFHSLCWRTGRPRWATETLITLQGEGKLSAALLWKFTGVCSIVVSR